MTFSEVSREQLRRQLTSLQIIAAALCGGVLVFACIVLLLERRVAEDPVLAFVALLLAVGAVLVAAIVPRRIGATEGAFFPDARGGNGKSATPETEQARHVRQAMGLFQTRLIVSLAILEGAAFLNLVAYMVEGQWVNMAVTLVLWLLMLIQFPSRARTETWVEERLRVAEMPK